LSIVEQQEQKGRVYKPR